MKRVFKKPTIIEVCFTDGKYRHYEVNKLEDICGVLTLYLSNLSIIQIAPLYWDYWRKVK